MSKGYVTIAQGEEYLDQAYALALSLRLTQSGVHNLAVCVDPDTKRLISKKHREVFDEIVDIPWGDHAQGETWKIHNKWKYYWMTPYDETVILDTDMIFPVDVSHWWPILGERDVWACTHTKTYRGHDVVSDYYRRAFTANDLPNVYTAFYYFRKSDLAAEIAGITEIVFQHWQRFYHKYVPKQKPEQLSGDVAYALAIKLAGAEHLATREDVVDVPTFTHMKSHIQGVPDTMLSETWCESLPTYWADVSNFKVGNHQQMYPFHYVEPTWLQPEWVKQMEVQLGVQ